MLCPFCGGDPNDKDHSRGGWCTVKNADRTPPPHKRNSGDKDATSDEARLRNGFAMLQLSEDDPEDRSEDPWEA